MLIYKSVSCCLLIIFCCSIPTLAIAQSESIEHYGLLPKFRSFSISPDGKHYAYITRAEDSEFFAVFNADSNELVGGANASEIKARSIYFATNKQVILVSSKTTRAFGIRDRWEQSGAAVYNIETKKMNARCSKTAKGRRIERS